MIWSLKAQSLPLFQLRRIQFGRCGDFLPVQDFAKLCLKAEKKMKDSYLLDTSGIFAFTDDEEGADEVNRLLERARQGKGNVFVSTMSIMEAYYITLEERGEADADRIVLLIRSLPITEIALSDDLVLPAGSFKGRYQISVADAWIAATAKFQHLTLVHKDPEFEPLKTELELIELPYKSQRKTRRRK